MATILPKAGFMACLAVLGLRRSGWSQASLTTEFAILIEARDRAIVAADTATLAPMLADDLIWIVGPTGAALTKPQLLAAAGRPQVPAPHFDVDSLHVRRLGDLVLVDYLRRDTRQLGGYQLATVSRVMEVFVGPWDRRRLAAHSQTWLPAPAHRIDADSSSLATLVGRYQIGPDYIDNVHWERGALVATASGQSVGATLVPVSAGAFRPDGIGPLMVFERDSSGHVTGYVQGLPDGQIVRARRLQSNERE
jgi:hypothetical protein